MRRNRSYLLWLLAMLLLLTGCRKPPAEVPAELTAAEVVAKLQAAYAGINDYTCTTVLTLRSGTGGSDELVVESDLRVKKPRMFREEVKASGDTVGQVTITNGRTLWIYTPQDNEVVVLDDLAVGEFVTETGDLQDDTLTAAVQETALADNPILVGRPELDGKSTYLLEYQPFTDDFLYGTGPVRLWVAADSFLPVRIERRDENGRVVIAVLFRELKVNTGMAAGEFDYVPPAGAKVMNSDDIAGTPGGNPGSAGETRYSTLAEAQQAVSFTLRKPSYLPSGFAAGRIYGEERAGIPVMNQEFGMDSKYCILSQSGSVQALDSYGEGKTVKIGSADGRLYEADGVRVIAWAKNGVYFILVGNFSEAELLKVAQSV